jgi:hypothetical protein
MGLDRLTVEHAGRADHDVDQIIALNKSESGAGNIITTRAAFALRCDQNPAGMATIPVIRDRHGDVVGFIFLVPIRVRVRGENHLAATGTNLVIQSDYRNTFGYVKLIRQFEQTLRDNDIPLHFSFISEDNYKQLRAPGNQTTYTVTLLLRPLNFKTLIEAYFPRKWQRFISRQASWLVSPFFFRKPFLRSSNDIVVRTIEEFDGRFDEFWRQTRDKYPVMVIRDRAFLSWRFAPVSGRHYHILVAQQRDRMLGYVVMRCATVWGVKTGLILDLLMIDHPLQMEVGACLVSQAEAFFRTQEMSLAAGLMVPRAFEYRILLNSGYRHIPPAISPRPFRFAFFIHNTPRESLNSLSAREWFITFADYESY